MNPLQIIGVILPLITEIPSYEASAKAFLTAIENMFKGGFHPTDILSAIGQSVPAITAAIVANTSVNATPPPTGSVVTPTADAPVPNP